MRVHWELKLPSSAKCQGEYCFRDRETFLELLSKTDLTQTNRQYEKWNGIDFSRQMAVLVVEEHRTSGYDVRILGVWKCASEILVEVLGLTPAPGVALTQAFTYPRASAVVNRSDLPVRFIKRTKTWSESEQAFR